MSMRPVRYTRQAQPTLEGAGVHLHRAFGFGTTRDFDPFLLFDDFRNDRPADFAAGFPWHPHRGIETITYVLAGTVDHADSLGNRGALGAGDVQWMTAGDGVIHSEEPAAWIKQRGGRVHGFQLWVNLPARSKRIAPRYQDVRAETMPTWTSDDGHARVKVIAGQALGVRAQAETITPITYLDVRLDEGAQVALDIPAAQSAFVYVFGGALTAGPQARAVADGDMALLTAGDTLTLRATAANTRALVLAGEPLREPVARYGPFVMNTREEIHQAFADYQSGRFGQIAR